MTAPDPRVRDDRVKATPKRSFLVGEDEWPDAPGLLDVLDTHPTVDDVLNPPCRPVRAAPLPVFERVLPEPPHSMFSPMVMFGMILCGFVIVFASVAFGYFIRAVTL